jgi:hypothetical protein
MQFTALQSTGMHTAIPSSGANAVGIGLAARPALPSCREPHDFPDEPLREKVLNLSPARLLLNACAAKRTS